MELKVLSTSKGLRQGYHLKDFFDFNNIQIWFYLSNFNLKIKNISFFGFLNLDVLKESLIFYRPEKNRQ